MGSRPTLWFNTFYFEMYESILIAREREKQIKSGSRIKKIKLIISMNPEWKDLYDELC